MKFYIKNFGCKVNQYEGEIVSAALESAGYVLTSEMSEADLIIVNTCVVTHRGERDAYRTIRKALRERQPEAKIAVIGCLPQLRAVHDVDFYGNFRDFLKSLSLNVPNYTPYQHRARAYLKVQEGCNFRCSYCIVPKVRGASVSRPLEQIIHEAQRLSEAGYRELVITGTQVGDWGKEWGGSLVRLIENLIRETEGVRFRLSSILPLHVTPELIELLVKYPERLVPHLHISLQSASDRILAMMRRPYRLSRFDATISMIVREIPHIALGTDIIVGFPTETEEDFDRTFDYIANSPISHIHVFEYSPRPGTEAEKWPEVSAHLRKRRGGKLIALAQQKKRDYIAQFIGKVLHPIAEKKLADGTFVGTSENYIRVKFQGKGIKLREIYAVRITGETDLTAYGALVSSAENLKAYAQD